MNARLRAAAALTALLPRSARGRIALAWSAAVFAAAAATAPAAGISRDEGAYFVAAESYASCWREVARAPQRFFAIVDRHYEVNREHPSLAKQVYGVTHALLLPLGVSHAEAFRAGAFLFAALLTALLALFAFDLAGPGAAVLAPALFWLVPRHFYHAHPALLDMPVTALWLATVYAYWRSLDAGDRRTRLRRALGTGLLFGAAVSVKHNAWFLPPLLLVHWFASRASALRRLGWRERLRAFPLAFPAMLLLGPLAFAAAWPWLWRDPWRRALEYFAFHLHHENYSWTYLGTVMRQPPFPVAYPFVVTALTVPAGIFAAMAGGLLHSLARCAAAVRRGAEGASASEDLLLAANALFPMALIAWPSVPHFGGVKHWLPAMPFLAILGARALVLAGRALGPGRAGALTAAAAALALYPALRAVAHVHPFGTAAWNELAGGAPGAASMGMQRQFWGDNMVAALPALNEHAVRSARVWYQEATRDAVRAYQRDGRLRADLRWADGPEQADISVYHYHQEFRDKEFSTWTQFRSARPVSGVYLDEVPLIELYARPGAWR